MCGSTFLLAPMKINRPISVNLRDKRKTHSPPPPLSLSLSLSLSSPFYEHSPFFIFLQLFSFLFFLFLFFFFFPFFPFFSFFSFPHLLHHIHMAQCEPCISSVPHGSCHVSLTWVSIWHHMIMPSVTQLPMPRKT